MFDVINDVVYLFQIDFCSLLQKEEGPTLEWFNRLSENVASIDTFTANGLKILLMYFV